MSCVHLGSQIVYPTRQPVMLNVLEYQEIVIVRSRIPGSVAGLICFPS